MCNLFNKLRSNYALSNVLIRILFVVTFVLYSWQMSLSATVLFMAQSDLWLALTTSLVLGVIVMFLVPIFVNIFLNASRFYTVPRAEYCLLTHLFCSIFFGICGVLKLINLLTPLLLLWGEVLIPVIVSLGCVIWFYRVTSKLYFNDVTTVYYFRNLAVIYLVLVLVMGVTL